MQERKPIWEVSGSWPWAGTEANVFPVLPLRPKHQAGKRQWQDKTAELEDKCSLLPLPEPQSLAAYCVATSVLKEGRGLSQIGDWIFKNEQT